LDVVILLKKKNCFSFYPLVLDYVIFFTIYIYIRLRTFLNLRIVQISNYLTILIFGKKLRKKEKKNCFEPRIVIEIY